MKRLQVLFLVALSSSLLLFGCGDKEDDAIQPVVVEPITESQPEPEEEESNEAEEPEEEETDLPRKKEWYAVPLLMSGSVVILKMQDLLPL